MFSLLFAILVLLSIAELAIRFSLYRRLKARHPAKYEAMDRPSVFVGRFTSAWAMLGFLVFRDHTLLKDRTTTRLADSLLVLRATLFVVFAGSIILATGVALATPPIPDGEYTFHHRFAEHPSMPSVDMLVRFGDGRIVVTNTTPGTPFPLGVVAEGQLLWNGNVGKWIIARTLADKEATEVGGCSDGPEVVDLEKRIYWTC